jgi:glucan biosynthesis protein C
VLLLSFKCCRRRQKECILVTQSKKITFSGLVLGKRPSTCAIYGFIFALGLVTFVFRIWFRALSRFQLLNQPLGFLPQYLSLFLLGLIAYRRNWFFALSARMGRDWLRDVLIAIVVLILGAVLFFTVGALQ